MAYVNLDLTSLKKQLYSRDVTFNYFRDLSEKDLKELIERAKFRNERFKKPDSYPGYVKLENYVSTLQYLTSSRVSFDFDSFDKKILFFILSNDPGFKTYNLYLQSKIVPMDEIEQYTGLKRLFLTEARNRAEADYIAKVREEIGFYDEEFLKYEMILKQTLIKTQGFLSDVKIPSIRLITNKANNIEALTITQESFEKVKKIAEKWYTQAKDPSDLNSLAYNILNNAEEIPVLTDQEQLLLIVLVGDPDLKLLTIYEEECTKDRQVDRAMNEVGFYNKGMINFEKQYHKQFEPEKQIYSWTK